MAAAQSQFQSAGSWPTVLIVALWIAWIAVIVVADFLAFMMFAFADSPGSANAAKLMIVPMFIWFAVTFCAGVALLIFKGWWQVPLAFTLAISPPFLAFLGYNLLSGVKVNTSSLTAPAAPATPPVQMNVPAGGFRPPATTQPDFQEAIRKATRQSTTEPDE